MRIVFAFLLLVTLPAIAQAQALRVERVEIIEKGIYRSEMTKTTTAPGTAAGVVSDVDNIRHVRTTTTIPAELGVEFGFSFIPIGTPANASVTLKLVIHFPPPGLRNPVTGRMTESDVSEWSRGLGVVTFNSYRFEEPWEVVPGNWTFEIWQGNRKLATQNFTVVKQ